MKLNILFLCMVRTFIVVLLNFKIQEKKFKEQYLTIPYVGLKINTVKIRYLLIHNLKIPLSSVTTIWKLSVNVKTLG